MFHDVSICHIFPLIFQYHLKCLQRSSLLGTGGWLLHHLFLAFASRLGQQLAHGGAVLQHLATEKEWMGLASKDGNYRETEE
jgi:hypothetical protein